MFGSSALEFGVGMVFVYLMLSLAVTALQEGLASLSRRRARTLKAGLNNLLRDPTLVAQIYSHHLVQSLHSKNRQPSYMPSRVFALTLLDRLTPKGEVPDLVSVTKALGTSTDGVKGALRVLMADANGNYERFVENVEVWFNHSMERVSGWYKRYTQAILVALAVPLTMVTNADSLDIGCVVWKDPTIRAALVAEAEKVDTAPPPPAAEPEELADVFAAADQYIGPLRDVRLPIGWDNTARKPPAAGPPTINATGCRASEPMPASAGEWWGAFQRHWVGWFITVLAISLGSPFWFDLLNKFMTVRGGGKAPEERQKSPKEEQPALGAGERSREARRHDAIRGR